MAAQSAIVKLMVVRAAEVKLADATIRIAALEATVKSHSASNPQSTLRDQEDMTRASGNRPSTLCSTAISVNSEITLDRVRASSVCDTGDVRSARHVPPVSGKKVPSLQEEYRGTVNEFSSARVPLTRQNLGTLVADGSGYSRFFGPAAASEWLQNVGPHLIRR
jgi:hypothetical protein